MHHPRHARKAGEADVTTFEVLTMGRVGVDLYSMRTGAADVPVAEVSALASTQKAREACEEAKRGQRPYL
jgi:hypothetical protein